MKHTPKEDPDYDELFRAFGALKRAVDEVNEKKRLTEKADNLLSEFNRQQEADANQGKSMRQVPMSL